MTTLSLLSDQQRCFPIRLNPPLLGTSNSELLSLSISFFSTFTSSLFLIFPPLSTLDFLISHSSCSPSILPYQVIISPSLVTSLPSVWIHCCPLYPCPRHRCWGDVGQPSSCQTDQHPTSSSFYSAELLCQRADENSPWLSGLRPGILICKPVILCSTLPENMYCLLFCSAQKLIDRNCGTFGKIGQSLRIHYRCESITRIMVANSKFLPAFWLLM
jgi:hypothetical protein